MQARSVLVLFFVVCTTIVTLFISPPNATAQTYPQKAGWFVEVQFENSKLVATMTIEIGFEDSSGDFIIDTSKVYPVHCQEHGTLSISGDIAEFDGNAYLHCTMPNFQEMVAELTEGNVEIADACDCKLANASADFMFSRTSGNVLFYMPELQFSAPYQAGPYFPKANYQLFVNGELAESEEFMPSRNLTEGKGAFVATSGGYAPEFFSGSLKLGSTPAFITAKLEIPTNETEFWVGLNPKSEEGLMGQLRYLFVDPGCIGHGGI